MRATGIVVEDPLLQQTSQMALTQWNEEVQTFPPQRANEPLAACVGLWTLGWGFQDPEPQVLYTLVERLREDIVTIMEEKAIMG